MRHMKWNWNKKLPKRWELPIAVELMMIMVMMFVSVQIYELERRSITLSALAMEDTIADLFDSESDQPSAEFSPQDFLNRILQEYYLQGVEQASLFRHSSLIVEVKSSDGEIQASTSPRNQLLFWSLADGSNLQMLSIDEAISPADQEQLRQYSKGFQASPISLVFLRYMDGYFDDQENWIPLVFQFANEKDERLLTIHVDGASLPAGKELVRYCQRATEEDWTSEDEYYISDQEYGTPHQILEMQSWTCLADTPDSLYSRNRVWMEEWRGNDSEVHDAHLTLTENLKKGISDLSYDLSRYNYREFQFCFYSDSADAQLSLLLDMNALTFSSNMFRWTVFWALIVLQAITTIWIRTYLHLEKKKEELQSTRNTFLNAIAHELKTPAAIIKNSTECIEAGVNPEKNPHYLHVINQEADHVSDLVNNMLVYTRVSDLDYKLNTASIGLLDLVMKAEKDIRELTDQKNIDFKIQIPNNQTITCDENMMLLVLKNFFSNAVKFTPPGGRIQIQWKSDALSIRNTGSTIPPEDSPHIWEPLYRGDSSRASDSDSSGMGLAICASILKLHDVSYGVKNLEDGVEFFFTVKKH